MESVINKAIEWFKNISEATKELTSGNVAHKSCAIRGMANRSAEYLEKHLYNSSIVRWQTGEPKEEGDYLTTRKSEDGKTYVCYNFWVDKKWAAVPCDHSITIAWYRIDDLEPYKEGSK